MPRSGVSRAGKGKLRSSKRRIRGRAFLGLAGLALLLGLMWLWGPLMVVRRQGDELAQLRLRKASLLSEQAELERRKQRLATEQGREAAARRQGYVKKGERRIVFFRQKAPRGSSNVEPAG